MNTTKQFLKDSTQVLFAKEYMTSLAQNGADERAAQILQRPEDAGGAMDMRPWN